MCVPMMGRGAVRMKSVCPSSVRRMNADRVPRYLTENAGMGQRLVLGLAAAVRMAPVAGNGPNVHRSVNPVTNDGSLMGMIVSAMEQESLSASVKAQALVRPAFVAAVANGYARIRTFATTSARVSRSTTRAIVSGYAVARHYHQWPTVMWPVATLGKHRFAPAITGVVGWMIRPVMTATARCM